MPGVAVLKAVTMSGLRRIGERTKVDAIKAGILIAELEFELMLWNMEVEEF